MVMNQNKIINPRQSRASGPILESNACDFSEKGRKMLKKEKKGQNIWKFGQKCTKCENILKKDKLLHTFSISF